MLIFASTKYIEHARTTHYIHSGSVCLIQPTQDVVPFKTKANSFGAKKLFFCHLEFDLRLKKTEKISWLHGQEISTGGRGP